MTSPLPDSLAELLRAAFEAWGAEGLVVRDKDGALFVSVVSLSAAERGGGTAPITSRPGPDPATREPRGTRVAQATLDGRLKAGHDVESMPGGSDQPATLHGGSASPAPLVGEGRGGGDGRTAAVLLDQRQGRASHHAASVGIAPTPNPSPQGGGESRAAFQASFVAAPQNSPAAAPHLVLEARLRHDPLPASGERVKSIRIARAPAGLPFRFAVTIGDRERMATGVAGVLRLVRSALDPDYEAQRLRVGRQPTVPS